ncbi:MAG: PorT family protein [Paludibacteraceae bacterium]|nr:PorT family protein [Paludibacteraceae bacterium]
MNKLTKIMSSLVLLLSGSTLYAQNSTLDYDFSVERSIWGANPVRPIEPEIKQQAKADKSDSIDTPFEKFDLSDLAADQDKRREELMKQLMRQRQARTTLPLLKDESHSHLGIGFSAGKSNLITDSDFGNITGNFTPGFNIDYYYFFNQHWGLRMGIGMSISKCSFTNDGAYRDSSNYIDYEGDQVGLGYRVGSIKEDFKTLLFEVPLMAAYSYNDWVLAAGFKFGFPLSIKYDQKMEDVDITAYYNFTDPIYSSKALGAIQGKEFQIDGKYAETPVYVMIGANIGRKFRINDVLDFGASIYVDYSLNSLNMKTRDGISDSNDDKTNYLIKNEELTSEKILTRSNPGAQTSTSSVLCSQRISDGKKIVDDLKYLDFGIKLSLLFSSYANGTKEAKKEVERKAALMQ